MATAPTPVTAAPKKVRKTQPEKHSTVINFTEPEDIQLYEFLETQAKSERRQLGVFILLALHEKFPTTEVAE